MNNLSSEKSDISAAQRSARAGHCATVIWFTGLSGSGKTTIARELERRLFERGAQVVVLDGDNVRQGLCRDLGFSDEERSENSRRAAEVAKLFIRAGFIVVAAFVSPFAADRRLAREIVGAKQFSEVYIDCSLRECQRRDPKQLYARAARGELMQLTGVSSRYEIPDNPDLQLRTEELSRDACVETILEYLVSTVGSF